MGAGPSLPRFLFAAFLKQRNLDMPYVPYRDVAAPPIDLAQGRVQLLITSLQATVAPVQSGNARLIAIANTHRAAMLPDVQTASEAGYPEMSIDGLAGFFGWRGMPTRLRDSISADIAEVLKDPEIRVRIEASGQLVLGGTSEEFSRRDRTATRPGCRNCSDHRFQDPEVSVVELAHLRQRRSTFPNPASPCFERIPEWFR